jgi:contractile injection system tube protein/LysM domain-containing protein
VTTPLSAVREGLVKAHLEILRPTVPTPIVPVRFNPTQYVIEKGNAFAEIPIPGLETPPIQFIRGNAERLTTELLLDTSDTLEDVRLKYTDQLRGLLKVQPALHAPPILRFTWDTQVFVGVAESMTFTYQLFTPEGIPLRANLTLALKEYRPVDQQINETPRQSPDVDKAYTVRRGDTLSDIAAAAYDDPAPWRAIARANDIADPRTLAPGRVLRVPRLT